ncbi:flagellar hook-length control protein FliK, partial [Burkholderia gladioli]
KADAAAQLAANAAANAAAAGAGTGNSVSDALHAALDRLSNGGVGAAAIPSGRAGSAGGEAGAHLASAGAAAGSAIAHGAAERNPNAAISSSEFSSAMSAANASAGTGQHGDAAAVAQPDQNALQATLAAAAQQGSPLAQAGTATTAGAAAAEASLAPRVGSQEWGDAFSQKVVFLSNAHQQTAELSLNPPDLGPLQVVLRVADNHAHALFVSQHPQVREAVEAALPKLREAMESGGLSLGSANVSDGGGGFAQQNAQQQSSGAAGTRRAGAAYGASSGGDALAGPAGPTSSVATQQRVGMVDTFA